MRELRSEVLGFKVLDQFEHVEGSVVEVLFQVEFFISEEVDDGSLFYVLILFSNSDVVHLFLGVSEMDGLFFLDVVSPHVAQLLGFVPGVHVVEDSELGTQEVSEMPDLDVTEVESNQVLVVENHSSQPLVVGPPAEPRNRVDCPNVEEEEQKTSSAPGKGFVVRRNLLRSNSVEERLHVVQVGKEQRVLL